MTTPREDGRADDELRPITITRHWLDHAAGSVLVTAFVHFALANGGDEELSPSALEALNSLDGNAWMLFNPAFGVMMLGAAGVVLSGESLRWLGWTALVLGVAAFVPFADFFALLGTLVWTSAFTLVGYAFSESFSTAADTLAHGALGLAVLAAAALAWRAHRQAVRSRRA